MEIINYLPKKIQTQNEGLKYPEEIIGKTFKVIADGEDELDAQVVYIRSANKAIEIPFAFYSSFYGELKKEITDAIEASTRLENKVDLLSKTVDSFKGSIGKFTDLLNETTNNAGSFSDIFDNKIDQLELEFNKKQSYIFDNIAKMITEAIDQKTSEMNLGKPRMDIGEMILYKKLGMMDEVMKMKESGFNVDFKV